MQVAICAYSFVCILVNALYSAPRKSTTSASCTVSRPSWAQVYRSGLQQSNAGSHKGKICIKVVPLCKLYLVAASHSYTRTQDGLDTATYAEWWCVSFHQLVQILHLHSWWSSSTATCAGGVFPWSTSAFINVHTNE